MHIKIKAFPDSTEEKIVELEKNSYEVYVKEPAKNGMANRKILEILSRVLNPKPSRVKIVSGYTSYSKIIDVVY